jgi:serine/threonine protein phosphatase PrpC
MSLYVQVAGRSDVGCVRTNNEDNFGYDWRFGIYVVCDGMGGQAAGEVASKIAVDTMLAYFREAGANRKYPPPLRIYDGLSPHTNALANAIQQANRSVYQAAAEDSSRSGMGSTLTAVLVEGPVYSIAHVGDSRIYLLRQDSIQQLTADHSLVMEQVRMGLITPEQAQHSNIQNIIIRALGSEDTVEPDLSELHAEAGDIVLLTTDGLTRHLNDEKILELTSQRPSLRQACNALIDEAKNCGGQDNITCLMLRFAEAPWGHSLFGGGPGEGSPKWQDSL